MFVADTPPPAYMPPDEQMGQDNSQSMDTSNTMIPQIMPNISTRGKLSAVKLNSLASCNSRPNRMNNFKWASKSCW